MSLLAAALFLGAASASGAQIDLTWVDNSGNESGFKIQRATGSGSFAQIATVAANVTAYTDSSVAAGTSYSYRVAAYDSSGDSSFSNTATASVPGAANQAPTISNVANQSIVQDSSTTAIAVTVGDAETAAGSLSFAGSSSNSTLVPNAGIVIGGIGANRTVTVTPASGQTGSATITLTVSDGELTATDTFVLTVTGIAPSNTAPTISAIGDVAVNLGSPVGAIGFSIADAESSASSLSVSASSSNSALVPTGALVLGGSGASRTLTITPAGGLTGSAQITVTVSDGSLSSSTSFALTVSGNGGLTASATGGVASAALTSAQTGSFTATFSATPSAGNIDGVIGLSAGVPAGFFELATIVRFNESGTIDARDGGSYVAASTVSYSGGATYQFRLLVNVATHTYSAFVTPPGGAEASLGSGLAFRTEQAAVASLDTLGVIVDAPADGALTVGDISITSTGTTNTAPTISNIFSRTVTEDASTGAITFTVADAESAASSLAVTAGSSNTALVPAGNLVLGGSGGTRTITATPLANQSGSATITVTVSDGALSATDTFLLTVSAVNDAPTISSLGNQTINAGGSTGARAFTIGDVETAASSLTVTASSSNGVLVPASGLALGGSGASRSVSVTPAAGQSGTSTITVTVSDGSASSNASFVLTVTSAGGSNNPPTVTNVDNQAAASGGQVGPLTFTIADSESGALGLSVTATSSNQTLVPNANIVLGGAGANRTIAVFAASGQSGSTTISITVSDGTNTTTESFVVSFGTAQAPDSRMLNLSSRVMYREGREDLIPGFVISGTENKQVLLRAVGPTLGTAPYNVAGVLPDPTMTLKRWNGSAFVDVASNDDWNSNTNVAEIRQVSDAVSAFPLVEGSYDAVLLVDLAPGQYTITANDVNGASGVVIVEIYDAEPENTNASLINMSNRGFVGSGGEVMITGFVVSSEAPKTLLVRAVGPGLAVAPFNVANTIADPIMSLYRRNPDGTDTLVLMSDNWSDDPDAAEIASITNDVFAFPLPAGSKDAAVVLTLDPGVYTVVVSGVNGASGTALVEVYTVD